MAVVEESLESRAIKTLVHIKNFSQSLIRFKQDSLEFEIGLIILNNVGCFGANPSGQVLYVVRTMILAQFFGSSPSTVIDLETLVEIIVRDKAVDQSEPHWPHGVIFAEFKLVKLLVDDIGWFHLD